MGRSLAALLGLLLLGLLLPAAPAAAQGNAPMGAPPPNIQVTRRAVTVLEADPESHTLAILERLDLENSGDAPFVPSSSQGPMGLLRFALPRDAFDLTLDARLGAAEIIQVDRGFASLLTLPPGTTDVSFGYHVPYGRDAYDFATTMVYPTAGFWLLAPADLAADSADLREDRVVDIGRQRYRLLVGQNLAAGQRVSVALGNLPFTPRPWPLDETVQRVTAAALAVLGVLAAWAYAQRRGRPLPAA